MGASRTQERPARGKITPEMVAALIATSIISGAPLSVAALAPLLLRLIPIGLPDADVIVNYVAGLVSTSPPRGARREQESLTTESRKLQAERRGQYAVNALQRLVEAESLNDAIAKEARFFRRHVRANSSREAATSDALDAKMKHGEKLGWYAVMDERTTAECREAHGKNFSADEIPPQGLPGSVHEECRCKYGPPHDEGEKA